MYVDVDDSLMAKRQVDLAKLVISETGPEQIIFLRERGGQRRGFSIRIGLWEALAIDRKVRNAPTPRPMTHDLMENILRSLNAELVEVVVTELKDETFFAKLVIGIDGRKIEVDSRPSDAIALAVHMKAPIFVEEDVLERAAAE